MVTGVAHVATAESLRAELSKSESEESHLRGELEAARLRTNNVHRAGVQILGAMEAAMAPLMAELAEAHRAVRSRGLTLEFPPQSRELPGSQGEGGATASDAASDLPGTRTNREIEAEIKHLQVDIAHFQHKTERLHVERRQRQHEIGRLDTELQEVREQLAYDQQRARHFEVCQSLGAEVADGWAGVGPCGVGQRTLELRAEVKLREKAEQRRNKLTREVGRLQTLVISQRQTIETYTKRLQRAHSSYVMKDKHLAAAVHQASHAQKRLQQQQEFSSVVTESETPPSQVSRGLELPDAEDGTEDEEGKGYDSVANQCEVELQPVGACDNLGYPVDPVPRSGALIRKGGRQKLKKDPTTASTGKLPQLSF